jgi:hypothetical protein
MGPVEGPMEPLKLPDSWERVRTQEDESTEAPLLHLKSLYCTVLYCFASDHRLLRRPSSI